MADEPEPERWRRANADAPPSWLGGGPEQEEARACAFCGEVPPPASSFCPNCGRAVTASLLPSARQGRNCPLHRHRRFHPSHRAPRRPPMGNDHRRTQRDRPGRVASARGIRGQADRRRLLDRLRRRDASAALCRPRPTAGDGGRRSTRRRLAREAENGHPPRRRHPQTGR